MQTLPPASMTQPFAQAGGKQRGGACGCMMKGGLRNKGRSTRKNNYRRSKGGYRATAKNRKYLRKWKQGKSIGFTMLASLKAKGLIPRASGEKIVSPKYK
jgi:hypothetical protein